MLKELLDINKEFPEVQLRDETEEILKKFNELLEMVTEDISGIDIPIQDVSSLKKRIKYCKNPMERRILQQELNALYRNQKRRRWHIESNLTIEDRVGYLTKEMKKYDESYNGEIEDVVLDNKEIIEQINSWLSINGTYTSEYKRQFKEKLRKELNNVEKNNVKQFVDLLLDGETIERAANTSGVGKMKMIDVLKAISCSEYTEEISKVIAGVKEANAMQDLVDSAKEAIKTVKELDTALVGLTKVTDMPTQELKELYDSSVKTTESSDK